MKKHAYYCKFCGAISFAGRDGLDKRCDSCGAMRVYPLRLPAIVKVWLYKLLIKTKAA